MPKEVVFDENGAPIEEVHEEIVQEQEEIVEDPAASDEEVVDDGTGKPATDPNEGKIRIGDQYFDDEEKALAYAESLHVAPATDPNAGIRRDVQDILSRLPQHQKVTQTEEDKAAIQARLLEDPESYLAERDQAVEERVLQRIQGTQDSRAHAERVWSEFSARHPDLADFRDEVNMLADHNMKALQAINTTKGPAAGYDFVAVKMRSRLKKYAEAKAPKRELPNKGSTGTPNANASAKGNQKVVDKKPLSLRQQLAILKKEKRQ